MSHPWACECKVCLCWKGTRRKGGLCRNCEKGKHPGDPR